MSAAGKGFAGLDALGPVDFGRAVENGFGISVKSVSALRGRSHSLNFKVVDSDGLARLFKCVRPGSGDAVRRLFVHSRSAETRLAPRLLFDGKTVDIGGCRVFAMSWVDGESKQPDSLVPGSAAHLADRHAELLGSLRDDGEILPARDLASVRREILEKLGDSPSGWTSRRSYATLRGRASYTATSILGTCFGRTATFRAFWISRSSGSDIPRKISSAT